MTVTQDIQVMANFGKVLKGLSILGTVIKLAAAGFLVIQAVSFFVTAKNAGGLKNASRLL